MTCTHVVSGIRPKMSDVAVLMGAYLMDGYCPYDLRDNAWRVEDGLR